MTPFEIVFAAGLGRHHGPVALALLYAVGAAGGEWQGNGEELAGLIGCSFRQLQIVRSALVKSAVLTYISGQRGKPGVYRLATPPQLVLGADAAGEGAPPPASVPAKKDRKPQPSDPLFEVITDFAFGGVRTSASRVAKLANEMVKAGLTAERLRSELPVVVARFAPHRGTLDLNTITACWVWILSPPAVVGKAGKTPPSAFELAGQAMANGNPFRQPLTEVNE